ncbi:MAG: 3-oxoacyl-ACP reductase FabG [Clostridia bacterium]|nr:3-oxoacyl-ACP reductase FabG [Clostridia bacterium]
MSKVVLITGASGGIGSAAARAFAKAGYKTAINYRINKTAAQELCSELNGLYGKNGCIAETFGADVSDFDQVQNMFAEIREALGEISVLVNNAGTGKQLMFQDITPRLWRDTFAVNTDSVFNCCRAALPYMLNQKSGRIINISSIWGECGASCEVHYSASKAAVIGFTKALAKELGPSGITVNCVSPGVIDTKMNAHLDSDSINALIDETPLCRLGSPDDIANAILFLASDKASFITGQILGVNGGFVI